MQAPLSPWAAAPLEDAELDATTIVPPDTDAPLIVEGAGGLYVPIDDRHMMIDLIARLGMPVVLAARSGLGTINHTLLSLEALRRRGIPVLGVVMSGPLSPGNREAIERFGDVRVLAEIPPLARVDAAAVAELARGIAPLADCLAALEAIWRRVRRLNPPPRRFNRRSAARASRARPARAANSCRAPRRPAESAAAAAWPWT